MNEDNKVINLSDYVRNNMEANHVDLEPIFTASITPEAALVQRTFAFGVDTFAVICLNVLVYTAYSLFVSEFLFPLNRSVSQNLLNGNISLQLGLFLVLFASYFIYTGVVLGGKTLGKTFFKLTVINENFVTNHLESDHHMNYSQATQRSLGYLLCYLSAGTFFIFNFASEDNRGLSDYLSNTRTVNDKWLESMLEHKAYAAQEVQIDIDSLPKVA